MSEPTPNPEPGQITHIFLHPQVPAPPGQHHHPPVYVCVQPYASLQPSAEPELSDIDQMYRRFGFAGGFLCKNDFSTLIIIEPSNIISHIAVTPLKIGGHRVLHILPMDRVRLSQDFRSKRTHGKTFSITSSCRHP